MLCFPPARKQRHRQRTVKKRKIPIVSIVGRSNTGKTTLIEKMIRELTARGYRVATIKHNLHGFDIDHPGKDSWRHREAGARLTVLASPKKVAVIRDVDRDYGIDEIRDRYVEDVDIILVEGYKKNDFPKIEVFRSALGHELLSKEQDKLFAIASDRPLAVDVPWLDINDARGIVDMVEMRFLKKKRKKVPSKATGEKAFREGRSS
jgi:molybdopterin-guanine dinucleotide biosynthesis protein MobB